MFQQYLSICCIHVIVGGDVRYTINISSLMIHNMFIIVLVSFNPGVIITIFYQHIVENATRHSLIILNDLCFNRLG